MVRCWRVKYLPKPDLFATHQPGAVAQLGERLICIQEVAGSIPTSSTSLYPVRCRMRACSSGG